MNGARPAAGDDPHREPQPGFGEALLLLIVMFAASAVAFVAILIGRRDAELDIVLLGLVEVLGLLFGLLVGVRISRVPWREIFLLRSHPAWLLLVTAPLAIAAAVASGLLEAFMSWWLPVPEFVVIEMARLLYADSPLDWVRLVLAAVVVIPLGEELFFRGLLLRGFLLRYGPRTALVLTSLLFAVVHFNPWGLPGIFLVGILLGWLVLRSGSLWPACLGHALYNLTAILALNASLPGPPDAETLEAVVPTTLDSPLAAVLALVMVALLIRLIAVHGRRTLPWGAGRLDNSGSAD